MNHATTYQPRGFVGVIAATLAVLLIQLHTLLSPMLVKPDALAQVGVQSVHTAITTFTAHSVTPLPTRQQAMRKANPPANKADTYRPDTYDDAPVSAPLKAVTEYSVSGRPLTRGPPASFVATHDPTVRQLASKHGLPPELIYAVIATESGFNPKARTNALGLMQIKPATARGVGFSGSSDRLYQPDVNMQYGTAYLAQAYRKAGGDICRAVSLYNRGLYDSRINSSYCRKVADHLARYGYGKVPITAKAVPRSVPPTPTPPPVPTVIASQDAEAPMYAAQAVQPAEVSQNAIPAM